MKQAIIDIGSNSMRLTLYEIKNQTFKILFKEKIMAGLAGYVEDGALSDDGIECAYTGLLDFRNTLESLNIKNVTVFATASLRNIKNTEHAITAIRVATGLQVEVVSGEEEALFGYAGAMQEVHMTSGTFVDIGGASTEIVSFEDGNALVTTSFGVGSLNLYRLCVKKILPGDGSQKRIKSVISEQLTPDALSKYKKSKNLVCVGGTARAVMKIAQKIYGLPETCASISADQLFGICDTLMQGDKLLFYPFDSTEPFLRLLTEAAERPDVLSIKITIYRLASSSKIARTLCRAAENGKDVLVLMELRARFDEENNIFWSKVLEEAGCQIVYGMEGYKCHSKICLITMQNKGKLHFVTQIGTGNYNEKTNAMYTDLSLMTASQNIGIDGTAFFQNMLVNNLDGSYNHLLVAPTGIKSALCSLIDEEIAKGEDGYICIKANSITEREIIDKLSEASRAGAEIQLIIRGICCILPGVPVHTENIHVTSIVGRYLEHMRIYSFGKGSETKMFISSADMMTRNLNRRVEIACPVYDSSIKEQLQWILSTQLQDTVKASFMMSDGLYQRKISKLSNVLDAQQQFMKQSSHRKIVFTPEKPKRFERIREFLRKHFH